MCERRHHDCELHTDRDQLCVHCALAHMEKEAQRFVEDAKSFVDDRGPANCHCCLRPCPVYRGDSCAECKEFLCAAGALCCPACTEETRLCSECFLAHMRTVDGTHQAALGKAIGIVERHEDVCGEEKTDV